MKMAAIQTIAITQFSQRNHHIRPQMPSHLYRRHYAHNNIIKNNYYKYDIRYHYCKLDGNNSNSSSRMNYISVRSFCLCEPFERDVDLFNIDEWKE